MVNLAGYMKQIYGKIRFYDIFTEKTASEHAKNPFAKPVNITIVWVEESEK